MSLFIPRRCRVFFERAACRAAPGDILDGLWVQDDPVMLESSAVHDTLGRYSVVACCPINVLSLTGDCLRDERGQLLAQGSAAIWQVLEQAMSAVPTDRVDAPSGHMPYLPGYLGYIGYEFGRHIERLPHRARRETSLPDLRLGLYDSLAVYDHLEQCWTIVWAQFDPPHPRQGQSAQRLRELLAAASPGSASNDWGEAAQTKLHLLPVVSNFTKDDYLRTVERAIEYIRAGDIFQVNLSQLLTLPNAPSPLAICHALRRRNEASHAAMLRFDTPSGQAAIISCSPELFVRLRDGQVITRPIKGTRPRIGDAAIDEQACRDLLASHKDNAELAMIIDLMRNDLGRVCKVGSIRVTTSRCLETHPTVFHLVGQVEGTLREGFGPAALLRASFPGGSITGAPKIRAMEIIDELEPQTRGVYTGCIGHFGLDGCAELSIAIRTIVCEGNSAHVQVGGGIVADSQPMLEYEETLAKARGMLEAIAIAQCQLPIAE